MLCKDGTNTVNSWQHKTGWPPWNSRYYRLREKVTILLAYQTGTCHYGGLTCKPAWPPSLNTKFCRPTKIIFSHISKFQFVYVFQISRRPSAIWRCSQRLPACRGSNALRSVRIQFPPQQTFVSDPVCVVVAIQLRRYLGEKNFFFWKSMLFSTFCEFFTQAT